jgi:phenylpropionate dioxygenase-like ring-hydroxylating dioxygenase large terminal subunit
VLAVRFAIGGRRNCVVIDGEPFVYARTRLGSFVLPARCRHRGGPLHLAALEHDRLRLVCPWHERRSSVAGCLRAGIPSVRRGEQVTAVFPHPPGTPYGLQHRPVSPDLDRARSDA